MAAPSDSTLSSLPPATALGRGELLALVRADQQRLWRQGRRVRVEAYLRRYPSLAADAEAVLVLVGGEWLLREEHGEAPPLDEYLTRFPHLAEPLRRQFGLLQTLRNHSLLDAAPLAGCVSPPAATAETFAPPPPPPPADASLSHTVPLPPAGPATLAPADPLATCAERGRPARTAGTVPTPTAGTGAPQVPGYEVLGELGRGGMGVVYQARQIQLNRLVALKMILAGVHAGEAELARFRAEAEALARLQHPHIVQVYEVGESEGRPFFSLEFIDGGSLDRQMAGTPQPAREAAALVETLARAMHAAHRAGVVHRDLKPANVLLTQEGQPKITDFGLAKQLDAEKGQTVSGAVLGTPSYMAPEQASGRSKQIGPAVDVYALGAILYECLTGRPPFKAATALDTLLQVVADDPVSPSRLQPKVPRDLETICLKCLQKEAPKRYASAAHLAEDLRRFLAGEPIVARPLGPLGHTVKWAKRRPALAALIAVVVLGTALLLAGAWWSNAQLRQAQQNTEAERQQALAALAREEQARKDRALAQVETLLDANPQAVPGILQNLEASRADVLPRLRARWQRPDLPQRQRLRVGLALLPVDDGPIEPLRRGMLQAEPQEMLLIRDTLRSRAPQIAAPLWEMVDDPKTAAEPRFRALVALAAFDPENPRWPKAADQVVGPWLSANPLHLGLWTEALRPVRLALLAPLSAAFRDPRQGEKRQVAAILLADFAGDRPDLLVDLLLDADDRQYAVLLATLRAHRDRAADILNRGLARALAPTAAERDRDRLARRQSTTAVTLLHLGRAEAVWPLFQHSPDPGRRTYLVHRLAPLGIDPRLLIRRLETEADVSARRALILSLGEFSAEQLPAEVRSPLVPQLLRWYEDDPDPGVHAAIDWLLRDGRGGDTPPPLDWGQAEALQKRDRKFAGAKPDGRRGWYVNGQGQTLALFSGPVTFLMGSPAQETDRSEWETLHHRRIGRSFALATKRVTVRQFEAFLKAHPEVKHSYFREYSPDPGGPIVSVTWYEAAAYCRWLSEQEGVPEEEMCYPPVAEIEKCKDGVVPLRLPADYLRRTGYRLPTEAEWEYACRAGAVTSRSYGTSEALLGRYAWYATNSQERAWPVGQKKPNDFGCFDMHGNTWDWIQESAGDYPPGSAERPAEDREDKQEVTDKLGRLLRGGSFISLPSSVRCAYRHLFRPSNRNANVGLRPARTWR